MANSTGYQRAVKTAEKPCETCKRRFSGQHVRQGRKYCSLKCAARGANRSRKKVCKGCGGNKPLTAYKKMPGGSRTRKCDACWLPRQGRPKKTYVAPKPCGFCHKRIRRVGEPWSVVKGLKFCGKECSNEGRKVPTRKCRCCHVVRPRSAFAYAQDARGRTNLCEQCHHRREDARRVTMGYMVGAGHARAYAYRLVKIEGVPMELSVAQFDAIHGQPCVFCGRPGCLFYRSVPEIGFVDGNVSAVCSLCFKWAKPARCTLTSDEVLAHAQRIVAHLA